MKTLFLVTSLMVTSFSFAQSVMQQNSECAETAEQKSFKANFPQHFIPNQTQLGAALLAINSSATKVVNANVYSAPLTEDKDLGVIRPHNFFTYDLTKSCRNQ